MDYVIEGAAVLLDDGIADVPVAISEGRIAGLGTGSGQKIDGRGLILAPAIVDIHGDAFERQMMPRPNVYFPTDAALLETDRQLASNGIATAYHALTLSWEPGLRAVARGEAMLDALALLEQRLTVENRVQLRWETFAFDAVSLIERSLQAPLTPSIAFNDHTTMNMRAIDMDVTKRPFALNDAQTASLDDPALRARCLNDARRAGLSEDAYVAMLGRIWDRRDAVPAAIDKVAALGRAAGSPMLSHDDSQPITRSYFAERGADIAEFPMCRTTAEEAKKRGEWVVLGAPNVLRGGSHIGSLHAADMVEAGLCDILASDYYYPAMLSAITRMKSEGRGTLPDLWNLVSSNPAAALKLSDRGRIAEGLRADLVLLDWPDDGAARITMTLSRGRIAYLGGDLLR